MPSPASRDLARRLLALEEASRNPSHPNPCAPDDATAQVVEKLRHLLTKLAGAASFWSLLSRALTLAKAEVPSLASVKVEPDGSLAGLDDLTLQDGPTEAMNRGKALVAQLLGLLAAFIGESLTLTLVRDVWPEASMDRQDGKSGEMR